MCHCLLPSAGDQTRSENLEPLERIRPSLEPFHSAFHALFFVWALIVPAGMDLVRRTLSAGPVEWTRKKVHHVHVPVCV